MAGAVVVDLPTFDGDDVRLSLESEELLRRRDTGTLSRKGRSLVEVRRSVSTGLFFCRSGLLFCLSGSLSELELLDVSPEELDDDDELLFEEDFRVSGRSDSDFGRSASFLTGFSCG